MKRTILDEAPSIIRNFLGYLENTQGKSPKTVEEYYLDLRTFFRFLKQDRGLVARSIPMDSVTIGDVDIALIRTVTLTDAYTFLNYVREDRDNHAAARARKVSCLRTFFHYLTSKARADERLEQNPMLELDLPKQKRTLPKYLTLEQSVDLLEAVDGAHKERDYCILMLFLNCGMRLSELVALNFNDIRQDHTVRVTGKGNKERTVYLNEACRTAINQYLAVRAVNGVKDKNALFLSARKQRISPKTVQYLTKEYLKKIGLADQGYSVHKLRHTAATLMYQHGGVDIRVLKEILGHETVATTEIYTHVANAQVKEAIDANPLAHVKRKSRAKVPTIPKSDT